MCSEEHELQTLILGTQLRMLLRLPGCSSYEKKLTCHHRVIDTHSRVIAKLKELLAASIFCSEEGMGPTSFSILLHSKWPAVFKAAQECGEMFAVRETEWASRSTLRTASKIIIEVILYCHYLETL